MKRRRKKEGRRRRKETKKKSMKRKYGDIESNNKRIKKEKWGKGKEKDEEKKQGTKRMKSLI